MATQAGGGIKGTPAYMAPARIQIAMQILAKAARPQVPAGPADLVDLMTRCWAQDAAERPAFAEVKAALAL
ncbi:hypothetical protein JL722_7515 [Aureococcus anophagefferens]|nr:hypothetical protein JL722_7515 [Aureococcus anophagefferens]